METKVNNKNKVNIQVQLTSKLSIAKPLKSRHDLVSKVLDWLFFDIFLSLILCYGITTEIDFKVWPTFEKILMTSVEFNWKKTHVQIKLKI